MQHQQPVAQGHGFHLVVGDVQAGHLHTPLQPFDFRPHGDAQLGVEVGQRLVEQEQLGVAHNRAPHRDALALAAGKLARLAFQQRAKAEHFGGLRHPGLDVVLRQATDFQPIGHVLEHAHMRIQRVVLEHHRNVALRRVQPGDVAAIEHDLAGGRFLQPGDQP